MSPTNPYFNHTTYGREQRLTEDLITEAIAIHGIDTQYLPRTVWNEDILFGEDPLSRFTNAVSVELWIKSNTGFEGQGDFLGKFGVELRDQVVFVMSRKRWRQISTEKIQLEVGGVYQEETANTGSWSNSEGMLLESGSANGYNITSIRPMEGDLLYFKPGKDLFEIKFVEDEDPFFPHGMRYNYILTCEKFRYSSEKMLTGNTEIDTTASAVSMDIRFFDYFLEDGDIMLEEESSGHLIQEFRLEAQSLFANNEHIGIQAGQIIDFSERSPFSEIDR